MEDAIRQPDLAKSVQRYQLAVDETMVRLNLAVTPNAWLMPARMVINTESTIGYNKNLKQAVSGMNLGGEQRGEPGKKKVGITPMQGKTTKRKTPPHIQPSKPAKAPLIFKENPPTEPKVSDTSLTDTAHENNKTAIIIRAVRAGLAFNGMDVS